VFNFKASPVYSTWQASDIPNHVTHQPSQADLCCGDCACLFQALTERRVNGGFVRFQAIRSRCAWSTLDIRSAGAFKKALARREESRDRADTIGTGQPAPSGRVPCDHPSPQAPAARVEPQLEMTHIAKNTTDMHAPPGSSRACRHRMVSLEPELTSTSSAGLGSNATTRAITIDRGPAIGRAASGAGCENLKFFGRSATGWAAGRLPGGLVTA
jgi:hypothetical protein